MFVFFTVYLVQMFDLSLTLQEERQQTILSTMKTIKELKPRVLKQKSNSCSSASSRRNESLSSESFSDGRASQSTYMPSCQRSNSSSSSTISVMSSLTTSSEEWQKMVKWADSVSAPKNPYSEDILRNLLRKRVSQKSTEPPASEATEKSVQPLFLSLDEEPCSCSNDTTHIVSDEKLRTDIKLPHSSLSSVSENQSRISDTKVLNSDEELSTVLSDESYLTEEAGSYILRISFRIFTWAVCILCVGACCLVLVMKGADMPVDYSSLWLQIIFCTLCTSAIIVQPLIVTISTVCRVMKYRVSQGCRGCSFNCMSFPLQQSVVIWHHYRAAFRTDLLYSDTGSAASSFTCDGDGNGDHELFANSATSRRCTDASSINGREFPTRDSRSSLPSMEESYLSPEKEMEKSMYSATNYFFID